MLSLIWLLLLASSPVLSRRTDYCYADDTDPYLYFASKTAYEFIFNKKHSHSSLNIPYCEPVQIWLLSRHGTRFPGLDSIEEFRNLTYLRDQIILNHESGNRDGRLCNQDLENLKIWQFNVTDIEENHLTFQGEEDLKFMAKRYKQKFPTLFSQPYSSDLYQFRHTNSQRTKASAEKFAEGLFGSSSAVYIPEPLENDTLIKSYGNCTTWQSTVDDNPDAYKEATIFKESAWVTAVLQNVSSRIGFRYTLKYEQIDSMYGMCRYDKAWKVNERSPWCAVFSKEELMVLEYLEDLKYYYKSGYGHDININLGCPPVKDFMEKFSKLETENLVRDQHPAGIFYFSHSTMLHMLQARMGVFNDTEPLLASNYETMSKRQWRVSKIGPFATNIAAVFFKCSEGDKNRVMFYASESPLDIEGCKVGLCSWDYLKQKYSTIAQDCNLDFCDPNKNGSEHLSVTSFWVILLLSIVPALLNKLI